MRINKVMVAIDGSEGSNQALEYAAELAKNHDGELALVHVTHWETSSIAYGDASGYVNADVLHTELEKDREIRKSQGEELLQKAKAKGGMIHSNIRTELLEGEPVQAICEYAEKNESDLIVIGNRGLSGLKKLVLGSVSQKVVEKASSPVLIVK